jgi:hypothetical protein
VDGTQYRAACKSNAQDVLTVVDNYGRVMMTPFPCLDSDPPFYHCHGHAKDVRNCQIACDDSRLFTTGGTDGAVFQWKIENVEKQDYSTLKRDETIR